MTPPLLVARDALVFFGINAQGMLKQDELFRFMESTGPQWWLPVSGMTRERFWTSRRHSLMARTSTVRILEGGCRPSEKVTVEHEITHGRRARGHRAPEYGFIDELRVRRDRDGLVVADLVSHTTWIDFGDGVPKVAAAPPEGLDCPLEELPPPAPMPTAGEGLAEGLFRWTPRECDFTNQHVSFPRYVERAENALADAGLALPARPVWQGWYRADFKAGEPTTVATSRGDDGALVFAFSGPDDLRPRVWVRLTDSA
ncbi:hypothetical protein EDD29_8565 [Actinocorallia herbida]|uniref:Uncharacterized protein n=1 Tax=Actinocorallia herbida TaxID=58109 RepID=A0A3N1DBH8_9ACTN|nr:hypothetical protein [Actinocorallia herbida]ROO90826.1 hypothetical protein EDD29_8565 [Actinocorallia herbida]